MVSVYDNAAFTTVSNLTTATHAAVLNPNAALVNCPVVAKSVGNGGRDEFASPLPRIAGRSHLPARSGHPSIARADLTERGVAGRLGAGRSFLSPYERNRRNFDGMKERVAARMSHNERRVLSASIFASFVAFLDIAVVTVALPAIPAAPAGGIPAH